MSGLPKQCPSCGGGGCTKPCSYGEESVSLSNDLLSDVDKRKPKYGWAPGNYANICLDCKKEFIGDKRASMCADCAYGTGR